MPASQEAEELRKDLVDYLRINHRSLLSLARQCGVKQPALHRFSTGKSKEVSSHIRPAVDYAHREMKIMREKMHIPADAAIADSVWKAAERSPVLAQVIVEMIEAMGPVIMKLAGDRGK